MLGEREVRQVMEDLEVFCPVVDETLSPEIILLWPGMSTEFRDCTMWMLMKVKSKKVAKEEQERREDISRWDLKRVQEFMRQRRTGWLFQMTGLQEVSLSVCLWEREKCKGAEAPDVKSTIDSTKHCFKIWKCCKSTDFIWNGFSEHDFQK